MKLKSDYTYDELCSRWDDLTAFKNYAGGDDLLDTVYISRRHGSFVSLRSKPRAAHELYGAVFYGRIKETDGGSELRGFFWLSIADTVITAILYILYAYIVRAVLDRGDDTGAYWMIAVAAALLLLICFTSPKTRRRYRDILEKITN